MHNVDFRSKEFDKKQDVMKEKDFIFFLKTLYREL